jgi:hypothetical protein
VLFVRSKTNVRRLSPNMITSNVNRSAADNQCSVLFPALGELASLGTYLRSADQTCKLQLSSKSVTNSTLTGSNQGSALAVYSSISMFPSRPTIPHKWSFYMTIFHIASLWILILISSLQNDDLSLPNMCYYPAHQSIPL